MASALPVLSGREVVRVFLLYEIRDRELVILVIKIGHRREVYRF